MRKIQTCLLVIATLLIGCSHPNKDEYYLHETNSKNRYDLMQKQLETYAKNRDADSVRFLSLQLDTQMKLEDFLIKFREVDSIKFTLSTTLITTILTALVSVVTTLLVKQRTAKRAQGEKSMD